MKKSIIRVGILLACFIFAFSSYSFIQRKISANKNPQSIPRYAKSQFLGESKPTNHSFKQGNNTYHFKTVNNKTISQKYLNSKRLETNETSNTNGVIKSLYKNFIFLCCNLLALLIRTESRKYSLY